MTKKDFIWIASMLSDAESRIETDIACTAYTVEQTTYGMEILDSIIANFANQIADQYPRFSPELFKSASRAVHTERLKQRILDKLKKND